MLLEHSLGRESLFQTSLQAISELQHQFLLRSLIRLENLKLFVVVDLLGFVCFDQFELKSVVVLLIRLVDIAAPKKAVLVGLIEFLQ